MTPTAGEGRSPGRAARWSGKVVQALRDISGGHLRDLINGAVLGLAAGFANIAFRQSILVMRNLLDGAAEAFSDLLPQGLDAPTVLIPATLAAGAVLLVGLARVFPGEIGGYGMPAFLERVNLQAGRIRPTWIFSKTLASAVTISCGGSAGTEGPVAQLGGAVGSLLSRVLKGGNRNRRLYVAAGAAGAIAASFNAPIAGILFAQEIILAGQVELAGFSVITIAAASATVVGRWYFGNKAVFLVPAYSLHNQRELLVYAALGIFLGLAAALFIKGYLRTRLAFERLRAHTFVKLLIGAALVGAVGIFFPEVLGDGYATIEKALGGEAHSVFYMLLAAGLLKMVATWVTLGSGYAGGLFAPSLCAGALLGGAWGGMAHRLFPDAVPQAAPYALVGMGALLAAATHAPLTAIFLLFEMTGNYQVIIPMMIATILGVTVSRSLSRDSVDTVDLTHRGIDLHHGRTARALGQVPVAEVMDRNFTTIKANLSLGEMLRHIETGRDSHYPVVGDSGDLVGMLAVQDLRAILFEDSVRDLVVAGELAEPAPAVLGPEDTLATAMAMFGKSNLAALPVVEPGTRHVIGMVSNQDLLRAFHQAGAASAGNP